MDISSCVSTKNNTPAATAQIIAQINAHNTTAPSWLYISYTCTHDADLIASALRERYPGTPIHGSSSHAGVMTQQGHAAVDGYAVAAFAFSAAAAAVLVSALKRVDFPTFGRPTMPHLKPMDLVPCIKVCLLSFALKRGH